MAVLTDFDIRAIGPTYSAAIPTAMLLYSGIPGMGIGKHFPNCAVH